MNATRTPRNFLSQLDASAAARLLSMTADVALFVDKGGVIRDVSVGSEDLASEGYGRWVGHSWAETVTPESRPKVEALLKDAGSGEVPAWRHVNHPSAQGADVPVLYSAIRVDRKGSVVAVGRSLRAASVLQQRLVEAQQSLERDYMRMRQAETRYRLLFQTASEAILVVDAATLAVLEANPAAVRIMGNGARGLVGRTFPEGFDERSTQAIQTLISTVRAAGQGEDIRVRVAESGREFLVSASLFRQGSAAYFLVRLAAPAADVAGGAAPRQESALLRALEQMPDGFVLTEPDGRVISANRAFLELVQVAAEEQVRGRSLDQWLGRSRVDLNVLIANLRQHGSVRLFATTMQGEFGAESEVEISAVAATEAEVPCLGFAIRSVGRRLSPPSSRVGRELPRSVEQLTELIGRVPLKDIVRETADAIERLCIEAALKLTGDNRASAAEMLGLSRQSLYVKLHRYGLGDLGAEDAG